MRNNCLSQETIFRSLSLLGFWPKLLDILLGHQAPVERYTVHAAVSVELSYVLLSAPNNLKLYWTDVCISILSLCAQKLNFLVCMMTHLSLFDSSGVSERTDVHLNALTLYIFYTRPPISCPCDSFRVFCLCGSRVMTNKNGSICFSFKFMFHGFSAVPIPSFTIILIYDTGMTPNWKSTLNAGYRIILFSACYFPLWPTSW